MPQLRDYKNIRRNGRTFCAVDVETTGLDAFSNSIIEIGCVKYQNGKKTDTFSSLVFPGVSIPEQASKINGITDDMVQGKPRFSELAEEFLRFTDSCVLVAHNIQFDLGFINNALAKSGHPHLENDYLDTLHMARKAYPGRRSYALQSLASDFSINVNAAHRAEDDARVCMELFFICDEVFNPGGQISLF